MLKIQSKKTSMQQIIFYKINKYFIQVCPKSKNFTGLFILGEDYKHWEDGKLIDAHSIEKIFDQPLKGKYFKIYRGEEYIFLKQISKAGYFYEKIFHKHNSDYVNSVILSFRHKQKEILLNEFTSMESSIDSRMLALSEYTFSEHYSLWVYHPDLEAFTCTASSFVNPGTIILNDIDSPLTQAIKFRNDKFDSRDINTTCAYGEELLNLKIKFVNRLTIKYSDRSVAVASFYSKQSSFDFNDKLHLRLSQILKSKLINELEDSHEKFEVFSKKIDFRLGEMNYLEYSKIFLKTVCKHFKYESSCIYENSKGKLNEICRYGVLSQHVEFNDLLSQLHTKNLQACVLSPMASVYNKNFQGPIPEHTVRSVALNPFKVNNTEYFLITINKLDNNKQPVCFPSSIDLDLLKRTTEFFAFATSVFMTYELLDNKNKIQQNFSKVWMHELRTPINTFTLTPDIIKHRLKTLEIDSDISRKLMDQLDDIKMFGSRLKLLTDTFDFKEMLKSKELTNISILKDVVFPIYNISNNFAKKQYELSIEIEHKTFKGVHVISDVRLLNMVLNAIVDNALKYSLSDSEFIKISGEKLLPNFYTIKVSNRGYPIDQDELNSIFEELKRGKNVISQKIHGTGIGLFIAKKIMNTLDGDVELTSNSISDIEFSIHIPINEKNDE